MLVQLFESCIRSRNLYQGKIIHQQLLKRSPNLVRPILLEKLTCLYALCNEVDFARHVFEDIPQPKSNPITWDLMIRAYTSNDHFDKALDLYYRMLDSGVRPTKFTYPFVLKACAGLRAIEDGKLVHLDLNARQMSTDMHVSTALLHFYAKCGELDMAMKVFEKMPKRDIVAWNAMISGFSSHGYVTHALGLLVDMQMRDAFRPNIPTILGLFHALGEAGALSEGKTVHGYCIRLSFSNELVIKTGLLDMYAKCKCIIYARKVFYADDLKNEVTWSAMIGAYMENLMIGEAIDLFCQMLVDDADMVAVTPVAVGLILRGCAMFFHLSGGRCIHGYAIKSGFILDLTVGNTIISFYAKCGVLGDALRYFDEIGPKDTVSYNAVISGCRENSREEESLYFFRKMKSSGFQPDVTTMLGVLPACSHMAVSVNGSCCHGYCIVHGFTSDTCICNALIDMYSKCGKLHMSRKIFDNMHERNIVSWNTMMLGYGIHGKGGECLALFEDMQAIGLHPDNVTFLALLYTCSHSGLVNEGKYVFGSISRDFNIVPTIDHYICMIDLLARAGHLDEAYALVNAMPFMPDHRVYSTLLAACRMYKNIELGDEVSKKLWNLGYEGAESLVLLSNNYSAAEKWEDVENIRMIQKKRGLYKTPGCSWLEVD